MNKRTIFVILVILAGLFFLVFNYKNNRVKSEIPEQLVKEVEIETNLYPRLNLPLDYFSDKDVQWGSAGNWETEKGIKQYTGAALDNKAVYQSYPTTKTTIKQYSTEVIPLSTRKFTEIKKEIQGMETDTWVKIVDDNYRDYGQLAVHFLSDYRDIEGSDDFDVDADGKKEKIVTLNSIGRADGGSYSSAIIKDNKIIFSVDEDNSSIIPADTTNGFYVEWKSPEDDTPRCCPQGYLRTRFVFEDGKFIPLYEQEVKYLKIGKE